MVVRPSSSSATRWRIALVGFAATPRIRSRAQLNESNEYSAANLIIFARVQCVLGAVETRRGEMEQVSYRVI